MEVSKKQNADNFVPPRKTAAIEALLKVNKVDHPIAKQYLEEFEAYQKNIENHLSQFPKKEEIILPELQPVPVDNLYEVFKEGFKFFNGKPFDENSNNSEGRKLARTLCAYFLQKEGFYKSPLLNNISNPNLNKGLMIIGSYGTGKTSILKTFYQIFANANNHPITVIDKNGTSQFLGRYKLGFGYFTANDVVKQFEAIVDHPEKEAFWKRYSTGIKYFDDIMTENTASNYGKTEVFKDILEMRYSNSAKTLISLNYIGSSVSDTLDGMAVKYGERVYDRLVEMFNIIELKGESLRK